MAKLQRKKVNLGRKPEPIKDVRQGKAGTIYPTFYISNKKLPILPNDVGKSFSCEIIAELTGIREESDKTGSKYNYDFEMKSITFEGK